MCELKWYTDGLSADIDKDVDLKLKQMFQMLAQNGDVKFKNIFKVNIFFVWILD